LPGILDQGKVALTQLANALGKALG
jgi:hypothetical protein